MALAPAAYVLWTRFLRHDPADPDWPDRDRFVLSCGHASMLLYALLHLTRLRPAARRAARRSASGARRTPGHPERGHTPGVETTTGPLGQGFGNAVGMAIAERFLAEHFNRPGHRIVDHRTWAFASDGDLMEGVASEAASLAGHLRLGKLIVFYDDNHITIDGDTALTFSEDVQRRFEAYGWHVVRVGDGNDLDGHRRPRSRPRAPRPPPDAGRPPHRHRRSGADQAQHRRGPRRAARRGGGPAHQGDHGLADGARVLRARRRAGRTGASALARGAELEAEWRGAAGPPTPPSIAEAGARVRSSWLSGALPEGWDAGLPSLTAGERPLATRQASGLALQAIAAAVPNLVGGSADLGGSTGTTLKQGGTFGPDRRRPHIPLGRARARHGARA